MPWKIASLEQSQIKIFRLTSVTPQKLQEIKIAFNVWIYLLLQFSRNILE